MTIGSLRGRDCGRWVPGWRGVLAVVVVVAGAVGSAAETKLGKGFDMDYGPFQCYTVGLPDPEQTSNMAVKGIAIRLGERQEAAVCFDTELMRYFAGWTGDFLDRSATHLTSGKGTLHARIGGEIRFLTQPGPGWGVDGNLEDPREVTPGALPKEWAHYKGLHRHGDRVVLRYTVSGVEVLEMPGYETAEGVSVFTRTIEAGSSARALTLLVCDLERGVEGVEIRREGQRVEFVGESSLVVGLVGAPAGAELEVVEGTRVRVRFKPFAAAAAFKVAIWRGGRGELEKVRRFLERSTVGAGLERLTGGGPLLWGEELATRGRLGSGTGAYVVDTLALPERNPWNSWMRLTALDFFSDGRAAVSTWSGDVWVVSGIEGTLGELKWKRFAAGLFEGLGLKILDDVIHLVERSQITRLHDLNGDGEADFYENFNNDAPAGPSYHAFAFGLDADSEGNLYYTRCGHRVDPGLPLNGGMVKVLKDGSGAELFAGGMRAPNGMSIGPGDVITCSDNQGNWVPSSRLNRVRAGGFYGYVPHAGREPVPAAPDDPICWLPVQIDNSSGGQVWVTSDRWGPLQGELLHTSYGRAALFHVLQEEVEGVVQGGVFQFPLRFDSGMMRGRFHPGDGQLYLCGLGGGWQTSGARDGALQRVRYTGRPLLQPVGLHVKGEGLEIEFAGELDAEWAGDVESYAVERWNYRWTEAYGSKDYSVADPNREGRDPVAVLGARLLGDRRTVFLNLGRMREVDQMRIQFNLRTKEGRRVAGEIHSTVNRVR